MTDRNLAALLGLVLAPKGEAAPMRALDGPGRSPAAASATWGAIPWPRHEAAQEIGGAERARRAASGDGGSGLGLGFLIRRQPGFASGRVAPLSNPPAARPARQAKRRQLTVRLPFDQFHRFHDLARRSGRSYQSVLVAATHVYLELLGPRR